MPKLFWAGLNVLQCFHSTKYDPAGMVERFPKVSESGHKSTVTVHGSVLRAQWILPKESIE